MTRLWPGRDSKFAIAMEIKNRMERTPDLKTLVDQGDQIVFVYGTLKQGFHNHSVLGRDPKYLGKARTQNMGWVMYDTGGFPVVMKANPGQYIYGEVYAVPARQMLNLDHLEANGTMYQREKVKIRFIDQKEHSDVMYGDITPIRDVWMYVGCDNYWDDTERLTLVDRKPVILDTGFALVGGAYYKSF